jgi:hypothetical protein
VWDGKHDKQEILRRVRQPAVSSLSEMRRPERTPRTNMSCEAANCSTYCNASPYPKPSDRLSYITLRCEETSKPR